MTHTDHNTRRVESDRDRTSADHDAEEPVNPVRLVDGSIRQFVIDECVLCGETHYHGSRSPRVASGGRSHRVAHCHGVDHSGGYYLELADDADPPRRWYKWVNGREGADVDVPEEADPDA